MSLIATDPTEMLGGVPADSGYTGARGQVSNPNITPGTTSAAGTTTPPLVGAGTGETVASGTAAIQAILNLIGMGSATGDDGQPLAKSLLTAVNNSGLDPTNPNDGTSTQAFVDTWLPSQTAYQNRFPGIMQQIAAGQPPTSPAAYLDLEDTLTGIASHYGFDPSVFSPSVVANLVVNQKSASEVTNDFNGTFDTIATAPPEVRQAYAQMYGANGDAALALDMLQIPAGQFKQQVASSQIMGAGKQLGVNVDAATSQKLAGLGVSYSTALSAAQKTVAESGLYTQTFGEQAQSTGPGATAPLTQGEVFQSNAKVASGAESGTSANPDEAVQQEIENRANLFRGGGGGASTEAEGYLGIGQARNQ